MPRYTDGDDFGCYAEEPLLCSAAEERQIEVDNVLALAELTLHIAGRWNGTLSFTPELICEFNRVAMQGIYASAGHYRKVFRAPEGLNVPNWREIPRLVEEMCQYVNSHSDNAFHAAAYVLWRTNWIHPFYEGNGRTSRELCNLAILAHTGETWKKPVPALLADEVDEYMTGLMEAHREIHGPLDPHVG